MRMLLISISLILSHSLVAGESRLAQLKEELGLTSTEAVAEKSCHLYLVHHGDTAWSAEKRLQGWTDVPLNDAGRQQMEALAHKLSGMKIDAIYSSDLSRAVESAHIIAKDHGCPVLLEPALRGESHGKLDGLSKEDYEADPHFIQFNALSSEEEIFFPVGEGGLSKADVARRAIPAIKEICNKHPGQTVVIVTHGGVLKFLNFLLGNYTPEEINEVPHGQLLHIEGTSTSLQVIGSQEHKSPR